MFPARRRDPRDRKYRDAPPASIPCATIASIPAASAAPASSRLVTVASKIAPVAFRSEIFLTEGNPKWKLTTGGFICTSMSSISGSSLKLRYVGYSLAGRTALNSVNSGFNHASHALSQTGSTSGVLCTNRLTLKGAPVCCLTWQIISCATVAPAAPTPIEPRPPA